MNYNNIIEIQKQYIITFEDKPTNWENSHIDLEKAMYPVIDLNNGANYVGKYQMRRLRLLEEINPDEKKEHELLLKNIKPIINFDGYLVGLEYLLDFNSEELTLLTPVEDYLINRFNNQYLNDALELDRILQRIRPPIKSLISNGKEPYGKFDLKLKTSSFEFREDKDYFMILHVSQFIDKNLK